MRKSVAIALGLLLSGGTVWAQQYLIRTVAGGGGLPPTPAPAVSAALGFTVSIATDAEGNLYFAAADAVFKVDAAGVLTRVTGGSTAGYSGDGGVATSALLEPWGLALDGSGNLYIATDGSIRKVAAATGIITTVAGNGTNGYSGDGGPATSAQIGSQWGGQTGVAVDGAGNLYISDEYNDAVRKVTAATGIITTVAGNGTIGYSGDGGPATSGQLFYPQGVAVDSSGNLYIADTDNACIRKVAAATGIITTVAGNGTSGYSGDGGPATSANLWGPLAVAVDQAGDLYIADDYRVRKVAAATGVITTVAGNGVEGYSGDEGPAIAAQLFFVFGVAVDGSGNLYIADESRIRKVAVATGIITTAAGGGTPALGDGGLATSAQLLQPDGVALDGFGNLYIADTGNNAIRKVAAATGIITTVAGNGTPGASGDGGPATSALLQAPQEVAVDGSGNLYIADTGNNAIRKVVAATGLIATVAGNGTPGSSGDGGPATSAQIEPQGVAVDGAGNLYVSDITRVRKVAAATGIVTTVAGNGSYGYSGDGGPATSAQLVARWSVALDAASNLYIADITGVREVAAATGIITTVAGNGTPGYSGDGGPATGAQLLYVTGVAVDGSGNLYISDGGVYSYYNSEQGHEEFEDNEAVRRVSTDGIISTVAVVPGMFDQLEGVAVDGSGNVYVVDNTSSTVLMLVPLATHALLSTTSTHSANFAQGQMGAYYSLVVSNAAATAPTSGMVTVTETVPAGLTLASMSGAGWDCSGAICTRNDALNPGASYPTITVTVNVAVNAPSQVTNQAVVSGGGSTTSGAGDLTTILSLPAPLVMVSPPNSAAGVLLAPTLVWNAADGASSYDVYFGTISPPPMVTNATSTSYSPGLLTSSATFYWQIVARNAAGTVASAIWSFTTGVPAIGSLFIPITPCRVADTRNAAGPFGGPSVAAGAVRSFVIPQSGCNVPSTAAAYSLNVTAVPSGPLSFLTLWPTGQHEPFVSTLNSFGGFVVANAAIVPAGTGGAVSVYASDQTDVVLDINGYFDATGAAGDSFYAATPCRIADTRFPTGMFGGPSMFPGETRDFPIALSSCAPSSAARAYSLNVTVVPSGFLAFLTLWPTGPARPFVSTLNSYTGQVVANAALVPAGTNGSISVYVTDQTDVILDTNGYFGQPGGSGALSFYPLTPCRVADTRNPTGPFGGPQMAAGTTRSFAIPASSCYVPSNAVAYAVNVTVVPGGMLEYLTAWATGSLQPPVSTLNSWDGSVVANAAIVPAGTNGAIDIYVTDDTQVVLDINGYFAP